MLQNDGFCFEEVGAAGNCISHVFDYFNQQLLSLTELYYTSTLN